MPTQDHPPTCEEIADVLARVYDGQPLAELRDEHAAHHLEAADAVLEALTGKSR